MNCKRCEQVMSPAERACYRVLCEDCWCSTNWVTQTPPSRRPYRIREAERRAHTQPANKD
jgi:hypothetical protein